MLIITLVSLLMAATMGWLALRLLREEQRRSEARVLALSTALDEPWSRERVEPAPFAWPRVHERSVASTEPARDATRAHAPVVPSGMPQLVPIDSDGGDDFFAAADARHGMRAPDRAVPDINTTASPREEATAPVSEPSSSRGLFGADALEVTPRGDRRWLAMAVVVLVGLGVLSVLWSTSGTATTTPPATTASAPAPGGIPLELVSLGHEQSTSSLVVRGLVRNPAAGSSRTGTAASVFLFDEAGGFLGSSRSVLDTPTLTPGDHASFEVSFPANARVRRYRVTFRTVDGAVVPHVDKRTAGGTSPEAR